MAESNNEDLELKPADAGIGFRFEMATTAFLFGYWKHILGVVALGLLCVLFYGQWQNKVQREQRELAAQIAEVERTLPGALVELPQMMSAGQEAITPEALTEAAGKIEALATVGDGPGAAEGLLKAAELYRLAGAPDKQRAALEAASGRGVGVLKFSVEAALANLDLEQGKGEDAVGRLRTLRDANEGYLAQQAALDLALALESLDRKAEAAQVYDEFLAKWPDSPKNEEVSSRKARLGGEG